MASNREARAAELGRQAADKLNGTCQAVYDLGEEFEDFEMDEAFCSALDDAVFCCVRCSWWFEQPANDVGAEWVCDDCLEPGDEDDV
jgi:hypothetical protein